MLRTSHAIDLMTRFAERTGVIGDRAPRRYLWTDAFAVCNLLGLTRVTGEGRYTELALRLVDQVHHTLGWHRPDDVRTGWISGLAAAEGEAHPTRGGLRIGKPLPERGRAEPVDERLEWERDGQYFHYLTKWMQALDLLARATGQPVFNLWARELAEAAHRAFCVPRAGGGGLRMYWKVSIDLSRPLVGSMGHHDPVDGFITCVQLDATAAAMQASPSGPRLAGAAADFATMIESGSLATADPLGLGGLLADAFRVDQLARQGAPADLEELRAPLLAAAMAGLRHYVERPVLQLPARDRLAFRELGLTIGLAAADLMTAGAHYAALRAEIESFWLRPEHRLDDGWREHEDINDVMLASSLVPEGALVLPHCRGGEAWSPTARP